MEKNILIIDNQQADYEIIYKTLAKSGHRIFPARSDYVRIMDYVKIYLLDLYPENRRQDAKGYLFRYIIRNKIDLLIVDYKLSGSWEGGTGIDLILEIKGGAFPLLKNIQYIFLTRTAKSVEPVQKKLRDLNPDAEWVEKGFGGFRMTEDSFFKEHILNKIPKMFTKCEWEIHLENLDTLINMPLEIVYNAKLLLMKKMAVDIKIIPPGHKEIIEKCSDINADPGVIKKLLKKFKT